MRTVLLGFGCRIREVDVSGMQWLMALGLATVAAMIVTVGFGWWLLWS
jgi:hypothetical protein